MLQPPNHITLYKPSQPREKYPEWREVTWEEYKGEFIVREHYGRWDDENKRPFDKKLDWKDRLENLSQATERALTRVAELKADGWVELR